jgi:DNA-directed RNA polymerase specialized sigma subunit
MNVLENRVVKIRKKQNALEEETYTIQTNNCREFPIDQFSRKEWRILSLYFRERRSYRFIVKAVGVSHATIVSALKRAIRHCPKLAEHRTITYTAKEKRK